VQEVVQGQELVEGQGPVQELMQELVQELV
jgi:hypothetical protein